MRLRRLVVLALFVLLRVAVASAEPPGAGEEARLRGRQRRAVIERDAGWALAAVGAAGLLFGALSYAYAYEVDHSYDDGVRATTAGAASLGAGGALFVSGLVLAIHGQATMSDVDWRLRALRSVTLAPTPGGLSATLRIAF